MPLIDLKTNLKSLKYGKDRPGGGSSNQPFIVQEDIDAITTEDLGRTGGADFILRGGYLTPARAATDLSRLFKLFTQGGYQVDFSLDTDPFGLNPSSPDRNISFGTFGAAFTAKQNLLSRIGTDIDGGYPLLATPLKLANGPLNEGVYTPLSTLGQALGNAGGLHLFKQGINPYTGGPKYAFMIAPLGAEEFGIKNTNLNRLVYLYKDKVASNAGSKDTILFSYGGGPGSILGVGKTNIKTASDRTPFIGFGIDQSIKYTTFSQYDLKSISDNLTFSRLGSAFGIGTPYRVGAGGVTTVQDFRKFLDLKPKSIISDSPDYLYQNIERRVNLGDPGKRNVDRSNYTRGIVDPVTNKPEPLDRTNALYLYKSGQVTTDRRKNDLVKFRIATIDNNNPSQAVFAHFRAYINSFTDSMKGNWNSFKYLGRGEDFFTYQGYSNSVTMDFTVVAQSIQELSIMFQKLNYLKSTLAPDYSDSGYMRGNIHRLSLGGYFYETPGIIDSLTYTIPNDTTWEIGIPASREQSTEAQGSNGFTDSAVKELPHRIEVSMMFRPIYKFLPEKVKDINAAGRITQRFISLEDSLNGNNLYANGVSNTYRANDHQIIGNPQNQTTPEPTQDQLDQLDAAIRGNVILGSERP